MSILVYFVISTRAWQQHGLIQFHAHVLFQVQWNLDLRKPDLRKNLDLRKIVAATHFLLHKLFHLRKIF